MPAPNSTTTISPADTTPTSFENPVFDVIAHAGHTNKPAIRQAESLVLFRSSNAVFDRKYSVFRIQYSGFRMWIFLFLLTLRVCKVLMIGIRGAFGINIILSSGCIEKDLEMQVRPCRVPGITHPGDDLTPSNLVPGAHVKR